MTRSIYVGLFLMAILTVLQSTAFSRLSVLDVILQPALLAVIVWALLRGPYEGLIWAFIAGIFLDLFSIGPIGATALALMVSVLLVVRLKQLLPENPYALPPLFCALAIAAHFLLYSLIGWVTGYGFNGRFLSTLPMTVLLHALLSLPIFWLLYSLDRLLYPPRIEA